MHIAFYHNIYPFGGGERVTADIIQGLNNIAPEVKTSVIAGEIDADQTNHFKADIEILPDLIAQLQPDALIVGVDIPADLWNKIRIASPDTKFIFLMHSFPLWQVIHKCGQGKIKYLREKLFHTYTKRYTQRYKQLQSQADAIVTLCPAYAKKLAGITGSPDKIASIYNPIHSFSLPEVDKRKEVLFVGRLSRPDKRVDRLIRIWKLVAPLHPDWTLKIVGDGPDFEQLQRLAHGVPRVVFCGYSNNPAEHYATASVVCLTSEYEGWPLTLVEALATGATSIAFDCSAGIHEILQHGRGILVAPYDEAVYASELDRVLYGQHTTADPQSFLAQLTPDRVAKQWLDLINSLH